MKLRGSSICQAASHVECDIAGTSVSADLDQVNARAENERHILGDSNRVPVNSPGLALAVAV